MLILIFNLIIDNNNHNLVLIHVMPIIITQLKYDIYFLRLSNLRLFCGSRCRCLQFFFIIMPNLSHVVNYIIVIYNINVSLLIIVTNTKHQSNEIT